MYIKLMEFLLPNYLMLEFTAHHSLNTTQVSNIPASIFSYPPSRSSRVLLKYMLHSDLLERFTPDHKGHRHCGQRVVRAYRNLLWLSLSPRTKAHAGT